MNRILDAITRRGVAGAVAQGCIKVARPLLDLRMVVRYRRRIDSSVRPSSVDGYRVEVLSGDSIPAALEEALRINPDSTQTPEDVQLLAVARSRSDGRLVAYWGFRRDKEDLLDWGLHVAPEHRRRGITKALFAVALAAAPGDGWVYTGTDIFNLGASRTMNALELVPFQLRISLQTVGGVRVVRQWRL